MEIEITYASSWSQIQERIIRAERDLEFEIFRKKQHPVQL